MRFRNQSAVVVTSRLFAAVLQATCLILLARFAGPAAFGLAASVIAVMQLLTVATDFGIGPLINMARSHNKDDPLVPFALQVSNRTGIAIGSATLASLVCLGLLVNDQFLYLAPLAVWMAAERTINAWGNLAIADQKIKLNAKALVARRAGATALQIGLTAFGLDPIIAFSLAAATTSLATSIWVRVELRSDLPAVVPYRVRNLIRQSRSYWMNSAVTQLRQLDIVLAGLLLAPTSLGLLAFALRLTGPLNLIPTSIAPIMAARVRRNRHAVQAWEFRAVVALGSVSALSCIAAAVLAPYVIPAVAGDAYLTSAPLVKIVCIAVAMQSVTTLLNALIQGRGHQQKITTVSSLTSAIYLGAVVLGSIIGGAAGACIGIAAALAGQLVLTIAVERSTRMEVARSKKGEETENNDSKVMA